MKLKRVRGKIKIDQEIKVQADGRMFSLIKDTKITNIDVFATRGNVEKAQFLSEEFGGEPKGWRHAAGEAMVDCDGVEKKAEVHWFEHSDVGFIKFKVKRWM